MLIRNVRGYSLTLAATGETVDPGETLEVDNALGKSLLEQPDNWQPVKAAARGKES